MILDYVSKLRTHYFSRVLLMFVLAAAISHWEKLFTRMRKRSMTNIMEERREPHKLLVSIQSTLRVG